MRKRKFNVGDAVVMIDDKPLVPTGDFNHDPNTAANEISYGNLVIGGIYIVEVASCSLDMFKNKSIGVTSSIYYLNEKNFKLCNAQPISLCEAKEKLVGASISAEGDTVIIGGKHELVVLGGVGLAIKDK